MKVVALVQARMGSTRTPGKILAEIAGKPMLLRIVERLKLSKAIGEIVVATTIDKKDDAVERFCKDNAIDFYRGSEDDITDRLYQAALSFKADVVVRIWGDCPLIDPYLIDEAVGKLIEQKADYLSNFFPVKSYPHGLEFEMYSIRTLEEISLYSRKDSFFKEFAFEYIKENSRKFNIVSLQNTDNLYELANFTVDYPQDIEVVSKILQYFDQKNPAFGFMDVVKYCKENKEIISRNKSLQRNIEYKQKLQKRRGGNVCNRPS